MQTVDFMGGHIKTCPRCEVSYPEPEKSFGRNRWEKDGLATYCRECRRTAKGSMSITSRKAVQELQGLLEWVEGECDYETASDVREALVAKLKGRVREILKRRRAV